VEIPEPEKAEPSIFSTDGGINSDCNDEQSENAHIPISVRFDPHSNVKDEREVQLLKQLRHRISIALGSVAVGPDPKYRITDIPLKSIRKLPETRRCVFPSSRAIAAIPEPEKAEPSIVSRDRGKQIALNEEHSENAIPEISLRFESDSNVNDESDSH
jgi:hypothetical protein